jgi:hypothetical protein
MSNDFKFDPMQLLLGGMENADPRMQELLRQQMQQKMSGEGEPTKEEILRRFRIQNKKLLEQIKVLKNSLRETKAEGDKMVTYLDYFLKLNTALAAALGSCENCWGEDAGCDRCGGEGVPGWRPVNKRLFAIYVQPCLDKLNTTNHNQPPNNQH